MKNTCMILLGAFLLLGGATNSRALEWMTGSELVTHCKEFYEHPTSLDGIACASYVQGFLGGAEATDGVVAARARSQSSSGSSFTERAIQTRLRNRLERFGPTVYANYCLPRSVPNTEVIRNVIEYIANHPEAVDMSAQDVVYGALKEFYPCE